MLAFTAMDSGECEHLRSKFHEYLSGAKIRMTATLESKVMNLLT